MGSAALAAAGSVPASLKDAIERGREDICFFASYFLGIEVHDGQRRWLESSTRSINVLVPSNRWGKTFIEAVKHLHRAFYKYGAGWEHFHFGARAYTLSEWRRADYQTISMSISADQSELVFRQVVSFCQLPRVAPFVKAIRSSPFPHIVMSNGAVIHARSTSNNGQYIDGYKYAYASYDEAGWEPNLSHLMGTVLLARLADYRASFDVIGTPKGRGDLYKLYMRGVNGDEQVYSQTGSIWENTHLAADFIEELEVSLRALGQRYVDQALYGKFVDLDGLVFRHEQLHGNMLDTSIEIRSEDVAFGRRYRAAGHEYDPLGTYASAWDLARKADRSVGSVLRVDLRPFVVVEAIGLTKCPWEQQYEYIRQQGSHWNVERPVIDSTGIGDVVDEELTKRGILHKNFDFNDGRGHRKMQLISNLQQALDHGRPASEDSDVEWGLVRSGLIPPLFDELSLYQWDDKNLETDYVMSLAMAVWESWRSVARHTPVYRPVRSGRKPAGRRLRR
ncbi:MAG: hypothetical protein RQ731_08100 [Anaerosomatales bacterium]|nr:hypothetical protein [Anaerosomatales bacterium]